MAIFHMNVQVITRSEGRSVVAASAYRAGEKLRDERLGKNFDYRKKSEVSFRGIYGPPSAPDWMGVRERLWNEVERAEKRKDAQLAREIEIALPHELTHSKQIALLKDFIAHHLVGKGMVVDVAVHSKSGNQHAHILTTLRKVDGDGFGQKQREWNSTEFLEWLRLGWATTMNHHLSRAGWRCRVDHRSLRDQGSTRPPTVHEGPTRRAMRVKGKPNDAATHNKSIEEMKMKEKLTPAPIHSRIVRPVLEPQDCAAIWTEDTYERKHSQSELFNRDYIARLDEAFPSDTFPRTMPPMTGDFHYRIQVRNGAIRDHGPNIKCEEGNADEIGACVKLMKLKGWKAFAAHGPMSFRRALFQAAVLEGFAPEKIQGYEPTADELDALRAIKPKAFTSDAAPVIVLSSESSKGSDESSNATLKPSRPRIR